MLRQRCMPWAMQGQTRMRTPLREAEGKSKKKRLENVPIVWDFPKVFPEDLPGLPLARKVAEGKSKKKRLENVPIVRDFPKVFPEDLSGLPPARKVDDFKIAQEGGVVC
nr:putative reverse transcriptase domain-containing protein [Tanacetum cinerariifolium]